MVVIYRTPKDPAAFATPEGQACAADRRVWAPEDDDVQMYLFDVVEV